MTEQEKRDLEAAAREGKPYNYVEDVMENGPLTGRTAAVARDRYVPLNKAVDIGKEIEAHTIERCAQVVKEWIEQNGASQHGRSLNTLLAAIRALKDKP